MAEELNEIISFGKPIEEENFDEKTMKKRFIMNMTAGRHTNITDAIEYLEEKYGGCYGFISKEWNEFLNIENKYWKCVKCGKYKHEDKFEKTCKISYAGDLFRGHDFSYTYRKICKDCYKEEKKIEENDER